MKINKLFLNEDLEDVSIEEISSNHLSAERLPGISFIKNGEVYTWIGLIDTIKNNNQSWEIWQAADNDDNDYYFLINPITNSNTFGPVDSIEEIDNYLLGDEKIIEIEDEEI